MAQIANGFRLSSALFRRLEHLQIPVQSVLRRAGLPVATLAQEKIFVTTGELFAVYRAIGELSSDPVIGLKLSSDERFERYDPVAIAALCSPTFGDALQRLAQYKQLTCPEKVEITRENDECAVRFLFLRAEQEEPRLLVDVCLGWIAAVARLGTAGVLNPKRVEFQRQAQHRDLFESHFECPIVFDAPHNVIVFCAEDLDQSFVTSNADLLAIVAPQLEQELREQSASKALGNRVKAALKHMIAGQRPSLAAVARNLGLSTRTLQRRLTAESLTFQQVIKESRRELAHHYLLHSSLELNETAYLLGYEDANSFFRAFQDWEGTTPGAGRASRNMPPPLPLNENRQPENRNQQHQ